MPGGIRTPDLLVRSQSLYPAELQAHSQRYILYHEFTHLSTVTLKIGKMTFLGRNKSRIMSNLSKIADKLDKASDFCYNYICSETLAQPVEHTPFKRRVEGSNPSCLTSASAIVGAFLLYLIYAFITVMLGVKAFYFMSGHYF